MPVVATMLLTLVVASLVTVGAIAALNFSAQIASSLDEWYSLLLVSIAIRGY